MEAAVGLDYKFRSKCFSYRYLEGNNFRYSSLLTPLVSEVVTMDSVRPSDVTKCVMKYNNYIEMLLFCTALPTNV